MFTIYPSDLAALRRVTSDRLDCEVERPHLQGPVCPACQSGAHDEIGTGATDAGPCSCSCHGGRQ